MPKPWSCGVRKQTGYCCASSRALRQQRQRQAERQREQEAGQQARNDLDWTGAGDTTKTYANLYENLCSYANLELAFRKARKRKTLRSYVAEFEKDLQANLLQLQQELRTFTYEPAPLTTFIIRDPKTRRISASAFKDRVVHHALCNVIEPIFQQRFIHDSFANQKGKGTHKAILRFEAFQRKVGANGWVLKADVRHYFDTVDHQLLINIVGKRIKDASIMWLLGIILSNHRSNTHGKGMPLGNLTSQFLANVYLGELDQYVKQQLKVPYYLRYVDDFTILHQSKEQLEEWKSAISVFLRERLALELHPDKSKILPVRGGTTFLGFRIFLHHRLLKRSNMRRGIARAAILRRQMLVGSLGGDDALASLEGWLAYAAFANTYKLRSEVASFFFGGLPMPARRSSIYALPHVNDFAGNHVIVGRLRSKDANLRTLFFTHPRGRMQGQPDRCPRSPSSNLRLADAL